MSSDRVLSMLGLARRAGAVSMGAFMTERLIQSGECKLLILATDAAGNNRKKFRGSASYYKLPLIEYSTKEELSRALGRENVVVAGVSDANFAKAIQAKYDKLTAMMSHKNQHEK